MISVNRNELLQENGRLRVANAGLNKAYAIYLRRTEELEEEIKRLKGVINEGFGKLSVHNAGEIRITDQNGVDRVVISMVK